MKLTYVPPQEQLKPGDLSERGPRGQLRLIIHDDMCPNGRSWDETPASCLMVSPGFPACSLQRWPFETSTGPGWRA